MRAALSIVGRVVASLFGALRAAFARLSPRSQRLSLAFLTLLGLYSVLYVAYRIVPVVWVGRLAPALRVVFAPAEFVAGRVGLSSDQMRIEQGDAVTVAAIEVRTQTIEPSISASGRIEALEQANIVSKNSGRIERMYVDEGEPVRRGQPLFQLERLPLELQLARERAAVQSAEAQHRLARERYENARRGVEIRWNEIEQRRVEAQQLKAQLDRARIRFEGQQVLYREGGLSADAYNAARAELISREAAYLNAVTDLNIANVGFRDEDITGRGLSVPANARARFQLLVDLNTRVEKAEMEAAASGVSQARADMQSTARLLEEATVRAPMDGVIAERNRTAGEEVLGGASTQAGDPVLILVNIDQVYAVMDIPETDAIHLEPGMSVHCDVDVFGDETFAAELRLIKPVIEERSHTVQVKAIISNPDHRLKPGMFLRGRIITGPERQAVLVPEDAILPQEEGKAFAFLIRDGTVFRVEVETGDRYEDMIEIKSGLNAGDIIAIEKFALLRDGLAVLPELQPSQASN